MSAPLAAKCRVRLSPAGRAAGTHPQADALGRRRGTLKWVRHQQKLAAVLWDGLKEPQVYHTSFLERV